MARYNTFGDRFAVHYRIMLIFHGDHMISHHRPTMVDFVTSSMQVVGTFLSFSQCLGRPPLHASASKKPELYLLLVIILIFKASVCVNVYLKMVNVDVGVQCCAY